ncbi:hypothetical protein HN00_04125 [Limosilactobacillus reuteri]|nr:hypothetical protein HN00_04125 [Limosilactobacillus reuteri]
MYPVTIGHSEVKVNPLGLGTNAVGGYNLFPGLDDQAGIDLVKTALDNGINLLDTAYVYGLGHSEELIGQAIQDYDRHKIIIATKGAHDFSGSTISGVDIEISLSIPISDVVEPIFSLDVAIKNSISHPSKKAKKILVSKHSSTY